MASQPYPFNQKTAPTSILAQTFDGTPGGLNMALPAHEIDDSQARILVDFLVDKPGITRQRGPVQGIPVSPPLPRNGVGLLSTLDPQGVPHYAALTGNSSTGKFTVLSTDGTTWTDLTWPFNLPSTAGTYYLVDAKPALGGGLLVGVSSDYNSGTGVVQGLAYWFGGNMPNYANTVTGTRGSQTVTGTGFNGNVTPGMFLFSNTDDPYTNAYIGVVLSVNSDTSLTLVAKSPYTFTAKAGTFQSVRGIAPKVTAGEITTDVSSTTVTGGNTKFISQGLNSGTWQLYRQSDGAFIGKVSSVTTNISITLAANAAVSMANEPFFAVQVDSNFAINSLDAGFLNANYADRQWYANRGTSFDTSSQVWFSDAGDLEALDLSTWDGNWFKVTSSSSTNEPIRAIAPAYNGLLVFKETETFIVGGSSPDSFQVSKLEDDGTICGMSVQTFGGGVIWAGREGINFYDGVQVTNLVANTLGQVWKDTIRTLDPTKYRIWSMVNRDHYFLNLENVAPDFGITKGNVSQSFTTLTVIINMVTRAVTLATNLDIRGSTIVPASDGRHAWYLVNAGLTQPGTVTAVPSTQGGTLAAGTHFYQVTALDSLGFETGPSAEVNATTTGPTGSVSLSWPAISGAASYNVYRGTTTGGESNYLPSATNTFWDRGGSGLAASPPTSDATNYGVVCDGDTLFTKTGADAILCAGSTLGPSIYVESKKFNAGDSMRLKRWKMVAMNYIAQDGDLILDIVLGLNDVGQVATTTFPQSVPTWSTLTENFTSWANLKLQYPTWAQVIQGVFLPARIRMQKKSQFMAFRLYGSVSPMPSVEIGPYEISYKLQRIGRV